MRTHLITSTHSMYPSSWHTPDSLPSDFTTPWKTFIPYTNVLWLRYILAYLLQSYKKSTNRMSSSQRRELNLFTTSIRELSKRLNVKTKIENGAFTVFFHQVSIFSIRASTNSIIECARDPRLCCRLRLGYGVSIGELRRG
jgi:hypothetical protein